MALCRLISATSNSFRWVGIYILMRDGHPLQKAFIDAEIAKLSFQICSGKESFDRIQSKR